MQNTCRCLYEHIPPSFFLFFHVVSRREKCKSPHHPAFWSLDSSGFVLVFFLLFSLVGCKIFHMCVKNAKEWNLVKRRIPIKPKTKPCAMIHNQRAGRRVHVGMDSLGVKGWRKVQRRTESTAETMQSWTVEDDGLAGRSGVFFFLYRCPSHTQPRLQLGALRCSGWPQPLKEDAFILKGLGGSRCLLGGGALTS